MYIFIIIPSTFLAREFAKSKHLSLQLAIGEPIYFKIHSITLNNIAP